MHLFHASQRETLRRAVSSQCIAFTRRGAVSLGEQVLDLSENGLFLQSDPGVVVLGDRVLVAARARDTDEYFEAEAEVARIVRGHRVGDRGYAVGLRFVDYDPSDRTRLERSLRGLPPPVPQRRLRADYAGSVAFAQTGLAPRPVERAELVTRLRLRGFVMRRGELSPLARLMEENLRASTAPWR